MACWKVVTPMTGTRVPSTLRAAAAWSAGARKSWAPAAAAARALASMPPMSPTRPSMSRVPPSGSFSLDVRVHQPDPVPRHTDRTTDRDGSPSPAPAGRGRTRDPRPTVAQRFDLGDLVASEVVRRRRRRDADRRRSEFTTCQKALSQSARMLRYYRKWACSHGSSRTTWRCRG